MKIDSVVVELIDICNLNCAYCLRDETSLHGKAHPLPLSTLRRFLADVKTRTDVCHVVFSGGEPTLHPEFAGALDAVVEHGWKFTVITNAWAFERVLPHFLRHREFVEDVALSIDGCDAASHDAIRGKGSFDRVIRAALACRAQKLPFRFKVTVDRVRASRIDSFATLAATLGADALEISPLLPTGDSMQAATLTADEQEAFLEHTSRLGALHRIAIHVAAGFYAPNAEPTCGPLKRASLSIDYRGRLSLCTVLAGFRNGQGERDQVFDLADGALDLGIERLDQIIQKRNDGHRAAIETCKGRVPLRIGSPCLDCLVEYGKIPAPRLADVQGAAATESRPYRTVPGVVAYCSQTSAAVYDVARARRFELNETAAFLWDRLSRGATVRELAEALQSEYEVDDDRAIDSVTTMVRQLEARGLIRPEESVPHRSAERSQA